MALEWFDGFDQYGPNASAMLQGVYAEIGSLITTSLSTANPRTGTRHLRMSASSNDVGVRRVLSAPRTAVGVGFAFSIGELPTDASSFALLQGRNSSNNSVFTVIVGPTGNLMIKSGGRNGAILAEYENPAVFANAYQHFECLFDGGAGFEVRLNEVPVITSTALPFGVEGGNVITSVKIGNSGFPLTGAQFTWDVDDLFCWNKLGDNNNDFVGDCKVYTRFADEDLTPQEWDLSGGSSGFALLDNVPAQDNTQYISATGLTPPTRSVFGLPDLPLEIVDVRGVLLSTRAFKTDAGSAKIVSGIISGGVETLSSIHALSMAPVWYTDVYDTDPENGEDWTLTAANQAHVLIERTE